MEASSPPGSDSKNTIVYCEVITDSGKQCSRRRTKIEDGVSYCTQHYKLRKSSKKTTTIKDVEPWTEMGILVPYESNGVRILQKIRSKLRQGPKPTDGEGYIYIYYLEHERYLNYWKIGRTQQNVDTRIQQWKDQHPGKKVILYSKTKVKYQAFVESLIHLYLSYCRMHRYPYKDGFHSIWALDQDEVIVDGQEIPKGERINHKLVAMHKHIEWFKCDKEEMMEVVDDMCNVVPKKVSPRKK